MTYRNTKKAVEQRERLRLENAEPRPKPLPELRMRITVERFDCGEPSKHVFELKQGKRIDMYRVFVDGVKWKHCGLSGVLAGIRKATPRLISELM